MLRATALPDAARRHLPRDADIFPEIKTALSEVPSPTNRLGVRSGGGGGTTPALGGVINAIVDALSLLGVRHIEMPATFERVWRGSGPPAPTNRNTDRGPETLQGIVLGTLNIGRAFSKRVQGVNLKLGGKDVE